MVDLQSDEGDYEPWLFDPAGLLLAGIISPVGLLSVLRHSSVV